MDINQFKMSVQKLTAAALETPAFKSLKGKLNTEQLSSPNWEALLNIPGSECRVTYNDFEWLRGYRYMCFFFFADESVAKRAESDLVSALDAATGLVFRNIIKEQSIEFAPEEELEFDDPGLNIRWIVDRGKKDSQTGKYSVTLELDSPEVVKNDKAFKRFLQQQQQQPTPSAPPTAGAASRSLAIPIINNDGIAQEIATIRDGSHQAMPPAQVSGTVRDGKTSMTLENGTQFTLYVFLSGPMNQRLEIPSGDSQTTELIPGNYEIAARVSSPNVIPFYGTQSYGVSTRYSEHFYIAMSH